MSEEVKKIWEEKSKNLIKPKIYLAKDRSKCLYYITQDSSSIIYMIKDKTNTTFALPKKYFRIDNKNNIYKFNEIEKLIVVSCPKKNKYELFVQKFLM